MIKARAISLSCVVKVLPLQNWARKNLQLKYWDVVFSLTLFQHVGQFCPLRSTRELFKVLELTYSVLTKVGSGLKAQLRQNHGIVLGRWGIDLRNWIFSNRTQISVTWIQSQLTYKWYWNMEKKRKKKPTDLKTLETIDDFFLNTRKIFFPVSLIKIFSPFLVLYKCRSQVRAPLMFMLLSIYS
jgi:hypothetical protein